MARNEKIFTSEFPKSFKALGKPFFYWKIRDDGGINPFDAFAVVDGKPIAIEYKITKLITKINMSALFKNRDHQIEALMKWQESGGVSMVIINWFIPRKQNRCFYATPEYCLQLINRGTILIDEFISKTKEFERVKDITNIWYWNLK